MNATERDSIFAELDRTCQDMCRGKSADYASDKDVLANFKSVAEDAGVTPFQVWHVLFSKHISSINNSIKREPAAPVCVTEPLSGRIIDAIVYLKLLTCLLEDNKPQPTATPIQAYVERHTPKVLPMKKSSLDEDRPF